MRPCHQIDIETPKKVLLRGLWLGPKRAKTVIVWVHGLNSSMFSKLEIMDRLVDRDTAVIAFNNRGHDKVSYIATTKKGGKSRKGGGAHEVFTECADDIDGAIRFAKKQGAKRVFLAGHSTGCQKSVYWASRRTKGVRGIILLAPVSDYAAAVMTLGKKKIARAEHVARSLMRKGRKHELLPESVYPWPDIADAQRFISLHDPSSAEEIFPYAVPEKRPTTLRGIKIPVLALLAEKDEYVDRPAKEMARWFEHTIRAPHRVVIIPSVSHSFKGGEKRVASEISRFMKEC